MYQRHINSEMRVRGFKPLKDTQRVWKRDDNLYVNFDRFRVIEKESHKDFNTSEEILQYIDQKFKRRIER